MLYIGSDIMRLRKKAWARPLIDDYTNRIVITKLLKERFCSFAIVSNLLLSSLEIVIFVLVFKSEILPIKITS